MVHFQKKWTIHPILGMYHFGNKQSQLFSCSALLHYERAHTHLEVSQPDHTVGC